MDNTYGRQSQNHKHNGQMGRWRTAPVRLAGGETQPALHMQEPETKDMHAGEGAQGVFGYVYHTGQQSLSVTMPGDVVPVRFGGHTVLSGLLHHEDASDVVIGEPGVYEIGYSACLNASASVHAALALQADGKTIDGSQISRLVHAQESLFHGTVLAELKKGEAVRLVMTSGSAVEAMLAGSGVNASLLIKKLG